MAYKKLSISEPCKQQWNEMPPTGEGRHCKSCNTTIIDFSDYSDEKLIQVLQSGKYHCGRFSIEQMGIMYYLQEKNKGRKIYWNSIAAAIVAGVLQISSGFSQTDQEQQKSKLYSRSIAFDKFFTDTNTPAEKVDSSASKNEIEKNKIVFKFQNEKNKTPVKNVSIHIKELNFTGTSNEEGEITLELNPKTNTEQVISVKIEGTLVHIKGRGNKGYREKTLYLELNKLINEEKTVYLRVLSGHQRKRNKKYIMGLYL